MRQLLQNATFITNCDSALCNNNTNNTDNDNNNNSTDFSKSINGLNSYFKVYSTDFDFSNKSNDHIEKDLSCAQSNEDLIKALKHKLLDELMPHIKIFVKEQVKFSKQEDHSSIIIIESLEKELEFLKQELVNKSKLIELYTSKAFSNSKGKSNGKDFDLNTDLLILNLKLVAETINYCSNM